MIKLNFEETQLFIYIDLNTIRISPARKVQIAAAILSHIDSFGVLFSPPFPPSPFSPPFKIRLCIVFRFTQLAAENGYVVASARYKANVA